MRMLVVGAGSTGGYFGGRLIEAGRDVTFLVRAARKARLQADGLDIVSPFGNASLKPKLITATEIDGPYDVVLLTVKAYSLDAAMKDFAAAVGKGTMIMPFLNGMRHMDVLAERFGAGTLVGCTCHIFASIDEKGRIVQHNRLQEITYGELDGSVTPRIEALDAFMKTGAFGTRLSRHIRRRMWEKWILLATLGSSNALARGSIGEIEAAPGGTHLALRLLGEAVSVTRAAGVEPSEAFLDTARTTLTAKGSPLTSSMYRDLQAGNAVEAEQIVGDLLARGRKAGLDLPLLGAAFTNLMVYQNRISATR
ncbi:ketopantoate reductase family protein [Mesorhizobium koreense]|uniref:ketopantoate reductase family protein n=1 Tax=Mesorhizobium koreense TaxID=3074855 RepID=UPI00287BB608|nr:ketopantoate reductase family protein [Mesorhizobium sp. WR6]